MTARIFLKLIVGVLCVLIVALTAVNILASDVAERTYIGRLTREMADKGHLLALLGTKGQRLQELAKAAGGRLTIVARDGRVIADSEADASQMENHGTRPEVVTAMSGAVGSDTRMSHTIGVNFLYVAVPVREGALRIAVPLHDVEARVLEIRNQLLAAVAFAFLPAILVAAFFARSVSSKLAAIINYAGKLARGEFEARLKDHGTDELGILSRQLNETGEKLQAMFEQLQREHAELEKLERIRKDFVINVSHELRTPLASIQGYTETLLDGALHDDAHNVRFLSIIRQNAERLARLTADLMTLSRLELETSKFQFASYYVNDLIDDCVDSMRPIAAKKDISLHVDHASDTAEVFCDSESVHQVMSNLLDNAIKYTPQSGRIDIAIREIGETVEVAVRDTGIGIPAEDLPRLFERFYRVDKARSRELGGTGLGLAIVKHLIRSQGGGVRVESEVGKGSTFLFTLPVHDIGMKEQGAIEGELTGVVAD